MFIFVFKLYRLINVKLQVPGQRIKSVGGGGGNKQENKRWGGGGVHIQETNETVATANYWHDLGDGRIQCDLCPRFCKLYEGQRGLCFVRQNQQHQVVLTSMVVLVVLLLTRLKKSHSIIIIPVLRYYHLARQGLKK